MAKLFEPLPLRSLLLPNRIVIPPMCQYSARQGSANDWHLIHLGSLALSGAGLLIIEATGVSPEGRITEGCLGLWSDENEEALARVLDSVRRYSDMPLGIQLSHAGRKASVVSPLVGSGPLSPEAGGWRTVGPSPLAFGAGWSTPTQLDAAGMARIAADFAAAARRADRLGLDLIELHCAHGYLLSQFLSPLANKRTDSYGGSPENRMRFPLEVYEAVRAEWPAHKPLGVRLNGTDWAPDGVTPQDAVDFARALHLRGCDYVDVSSGGNAYVKIRTGPGYQVPFAEAIRQEVGIATMAVGLIQTAAFAEEIVATGRADMVAIGRGMLNNPHWPWRAAEELQVALKVPSQYARAATSKGLPPPSWTPVSASA